MILSFVNVLVGPSYLDRADLAAGGAAIFNHGIPSL